MSNNIIEGPKYTPYGKLVTDVGLLTDNITDFDTSGRKAQKSNGSQNIQDFMLSKDSQIEYLIQKKREQIEQTLNLNQRNSQSVDSRTGTQEQLIKNSRNKSAAVSSRKGVWPQKFMNVLFRSADNTIQHEETQSIGIKSSSNESSCHISEEDFNEGLPSKINVSHKKGLDPNSSPFVDGPLTKRSGIFSGRLAIDTTTMRFNQSVNLPHSPFSSQRNSVVPRLNLSKVIGFSSQQIPNMKRNKSSAVIGQRSQMSSMKKNGLKKTKSTSVLRKKAGKKPNQVTTIQMQNIEMRAQINDVMLKMNETRQKRARVQHKIELYRTKALLLQAIKVEKKCVKKLLAENKRVLDQAKAETMRVNRMKQGQAQN